jgi:hypothetical protein
MSVKNLTYVVRQFDGSGERYLVQRANGRGYRWDKKAVYESALLTYKTANRAVRTYGGTAVAV